MKTSVLSQDTFLSKAQTVLHNVSKNHVRDLDL